MSAAPAAAPPQPQPTSALPTVIPPALRELPPEEAALLQGHRPPAPLPNPPLHSHTFPDHRLISLLQPHLIHTTVAVDPPASSSENADEAGIVVAAVLSPAFDRIATRGAPPQRRGIVLDDATIGRAGPALWAERATAAAMAWGASTIVVEKNQGGEMLSTVLEQAIAAARTSALYPTAPPIKVELVHAYFGKKLRAEPVSHLYDQQRILHLRAFPWLEEQLTTWLPDSTRNSPDRLDALVHAIAHLLPRLESGHATLHGHSQSQRSARPASAATQPADATDPTATPEEHGPASLHDPADHVPTPTTARPASWLTRSNMPRTTNPSASGSPYTQTVRPPRSHRYRPQR